MALKAIDTALAAECKRLPQNMLDHLIYSVPIRGSAILKDQGDHMPN